MIKKLGYRNVKTVRGAGSAMENFFDYHRGGKITIPNWYENLMGKEKAAKLRKIAEEMVRKKW